MTDIVGGMWKRKPTEPGVFQVEDCDEDYEHPPRDEVEKIYMALAGSAPDVREPSCEKSESNGTSSGDSSRETWGSHAWSRVTGSDSSKEEVKTPRSSSSSHGDYEISEKDASMSGSSKLSARQKAVRGIRARKMKPSAI